MAKVGAPKPNQIGGGYQGGNVLRAGARGSGSMAAGRAEGGVVRVVHVENGLELQVMMQIVSRCLGLPTVTIAVLVGVLEGDRELMSVLRVALQGMGPAVGQGAEDRRHQDEPKSGKAEGASHDR